MVWKLESPSDNESAKIKWELVPYTQGIGLDLGCGQEKAFKHFIGVDSGRATNQYGMKVVPNITGDCENLSVFASNKFDFVYSSHLLEHIEDTEATLKEWWRLVKPGGYLVLYLPHKLFYPNIGESGSNPDHKHDFLPSDIVSVMESVCKDQILKKWDLVRNEDRNENDEYSFFQVYRKTSGMACTYSYQKSPGKTCCIFRCGGYGDLLFASSVFPALKAQGFHLTVYTSVKGRDVIERDPYVDEIIVLNKSQIGDLEMAHFCKYLSNKYDRFINFSESMEGTFLALPLRTPHSWPDAMRHRRMNGNYLEYHHEMAEVPFEARIKFYATDKEIQWAKSIGPAVLIVLAGSAVHKIYPHIDRVIENLLAKYPNVKIVLAGDDDCKKLEEGWEENPRVICTSGKWTIRQTLSFASQALLVIGPETGVLNSVGLEDVPKIIFLSHSSEENLCKHWKNYVALSQPEHESVPCSKNACHRMHYGYEYCLHDEEVGAAVCQVRIHPGRVFDAACDFLG